MSFYVYQHRRADDNKIFYVGKGKKDRLNHTKGRSTYWHNVVAKHGFISEKIADNLDEELAFLCEMEAIDAYRRRGIKLVNMTDGGEGTSGFSNPHTEEHKQWLKGNRFGEKSWGISFLGKKHSEESRQKMSQAQKGNTKKLGYVTPDEVKQKISKATKGKIARFHRALSDEDVKEIKARLGYRNIAKLAREFGVSESTIRRIRDGECYKEII